MVWFKGMRDYSGLVRSLSDEQLFEALHCFFDAVGSAVESNGGEVLKFIGDAVLAVFPYGSDVEARTACRAALGGLSAVLKRWTRWTNGSHQSAQFAAAVCIVVSLLEMWARRRDWISRRWVKSSTRPVVWNHCAENWGSPTRECGGC